MARCLTHGVELTTGGCWQCNCNATIVPLDPDTLHPPGPEAGDCFGRIPSEIATLRAAVAAERKAWEKAEREVFEHHKEFQPYIARALAAEAREADLRAKVEALLVQYYPGEASVGPGVERELRALLAPAGEGKEK